MPGTGDGEGTSMGSAGAVNPGFEVDEIVGTPPSSPVWVTPGRAPVGIPIPVPSPAPTVGTVTVMSGLPGTVDTTTKVGSAGVGVTAGLGLGIGLGKATIGASVLSFPLAVPPPPSGRVPVVSEPLPGPLPRLAAGGNGGRLVAEVVVVVTGGESD